MTNGGSSDPAVDARPPATPRAQPPPGARPPRRRARRDDTTSVELRSRSSTWKRVLIVGGSLLAVLAILAGVAGFWLSRQLNPPGDPGEAVAVVIPNDSNVSAIASILADADVVTNATVFRYYVRFTSGGPFQAGEYALPTRSSMGDVVDLLEAGPPPAPPVAQVTIPEGFTVGQTIAQISQDVPLFTDTALTEALGTVRSRFMPPEVTSLEGMLFPETYRVEEGEVEADLLARMVAELDEVAGGLGYDNTPAMVGLTPYETIIVASLIEREARVPEDQRKIARVIYNRLEQGMNLEIDATVLYALGEHQERVLFDDLEVESPYNTYLHPGLPPTPIAAPGRSALQAALQPEDGPWLFYVVTEPNGAHSFAETFAGHQANIRQAEANGVR